MAFQMNKQRQAFSEQGPGGKGTDSDDVTKETGQHHAPSIHIHSHSKGHTVHVLHSNGHHEKSEHAHGDTEGIKAHIDQHLGGAEGQDHGYSGGEEQENEFGAGPGV